MLPVVPSGFVVDAAELSGHVLRQAPAARAPGVFVHGLPTLDLEKMATPNKTTYEYEYVYNIYICIYIYVYIYMTLSFYIQTKCIDDVIIYIVHHIITHMHV